MTPEQEQHLIDTVQSISTRLDRLSAEVQKQTTDIAEVKKRLDTLDSRFFEFSMRIVSSSQSAFYGVAVAVLSAVIAFVVAKFSGGPLP